MTRVASNPDSLKWVGNKIFSVRRNFDLFNPSKKSHLSRMKRKFIPAVLYSKDSDSIPTSSENEETARILKGERIVESRMDAQVNPSPVMSPKLQNLSHQQVRKVTEMALLSNSNSDLSTCDVDFNMSGCSNHVVLKACGVLAVRHTQVVTARIRQRSNFKLNRKLTEPTDASNVVRRKHRKPRSKTKSLDWDDRLWKRGASTPPHSAEFFFSPSEGDEFEESDSDVDDKTLSLKESAAHEAETEEGAATPTEVPNELSPSPLPEAEVSPKGVEEEAAAPSSVPVINTGPATDSGDIERGPASESSPRPSPKSSPLLHPSMKMSFSEGSIATAFHTSEISSSYENIDIDDLDDLDISAGHLSRPSTFAKLRGKMTNLTIPTVIPSPGTKRRQAERASKQNRIRSQLRFQECKTRIILL